MKKIIAGIGFELTGTLMLLCSSLIASMSMEKYNRVEYGIGSILATGITFSLWGVFSKSDK